MNKNTNKSVAPEKIITPDDAKDHAIIRSVLQGDVNAYGLLVKRYQVPVFNLLLRMLNSHDEAEELTQVAFIRAYEALSTFRFGFRFFSWLYRIAINLALTQMKQQKRYTSLTGMEQLVDHAEEAEPEKEQLVQLAIKQLNDTYKAVVILKYYQQLSYKEIGFMLGITEKKVRSRLYDARVKIKKTLEHTTYYSRV